MVNLWPGVPAECLCDKHLNAVLAEYNNLLMPSMRKGHMITKYILHGCIDMFNIEHRINECLIEATKRNHAWKYQSVSESDRILQKLYLKKYIEAFPEIFDTDHRYARQIEMGHMNELVLSFRCPKCRERILNYRSEHGGHL
jgi:hypothetical protein